MTHLVPREGRRRSFRLETRSSADAAIDCLRTSFGAEVRAESRARTVYYDTFDRRLAKRGEVLSETREGSDLRLEWAHGDVVHEAPSTQRIDFAASLPGGPIREHVAPLLDVRRLLPTLELDGGATVVDVLDRRDKTVARLHLLDGRSRDPLARGEWRDLPPLLWVSSLRGYDREFEQVCARLSDGPGRSAGAEKEDVGLWSWAAAGAVPEDPSTWRPELGAGLRADVGIQRVYAVLLRQMVAYEAGTRADLDIEFLHDFRIAVRRTRSLLALVDRVLPVTVVEHFRREFAWLGAVTGPVRDADVLLLELERWPCELPARELAVLRAFLNEEREAAQRTLVRALDSKRYRSMVIDWRAFLSLPRPARPFAEDSHRPLREVTSRRILHRHRRVRRRGNAIRRKTPPEALHELRIECKKMRYLIDCTKELWGPQARRVLRRLRSLQNVLGAYNDCHVQAVNLAGVGERLLARRRAGAPTVLVLGRLMEQLDGRALDVRKRFERRWKRFDSKKTRRAFRKVFAASAAEGSRDER